MFNAVKTAVSAPSKFLPRIVPFPSFEIIAPAKRVSCGTVKTDQDAVLHSDRSVDAIGEKLSGYLRTELTSTPWFDVQRLRAVSNTEINTPYKKEDVIALDASAFEIFDFDYEATGFPGASISSSGPATVYFVFDEILSGRDVSPTRMGSCNVIAYELSQAGEYHVEAFEPYSMRYCKIIVIGAACGISGVYLREYVNPEAGRAAFKAPDAELNRIFEAARTTFKENAVDGFMDCPSRERAGWLCDSFFTARVSSDLTGNMKQEKIFLQNFMIPKSFEFLPEGMLPMCYPADHNDGIYIPNWARWFVLELEEYLERSGDRGTVDALRPKVLGLIRFLQTFRNSDGLLERLPQCVFIEWSRANSLVQDVSYPTNMTYAEMLSCAARMYGIQSLEDEAENVRGTVRGQSFNGKFFVDNAIRRSDGSLLG